VEAAALGCRFTTAYRAVVQQGLGLEFAQHNSKNGNCDGNDNVNDIVCLNNSSSTASSWSKREKVVAIFGCGGLGLSCLMIAKAFQKEGNITSIIAIDVSTKALDKAIELGADHVINARDLQKQKQTQQQQHQSVKEKLLELTNGLGAEVSIDAAGFKATCENALVCTRRGCRMIQVGLPIGSHRPEIDMGFVAAREIQIVGSHGFSANDLPSLLTLVQQGRLDVKKLIEKEVTLEEGVHALMNMDKTSPLGMTMITNFGGHSVPCKL
jgi:alcohol dehydrogenase